MSVDRSWAVPYLVFEDLWRGQDRIVFDPILMSLSRESGSGLEEKFGSAFAELVGELIDVEDSASNRYPMLIDDAIDLNDSSVSYTESNEQVPDRISAQEPDQNDQRPRHRCGLEQGVSAIENDGWQSAWFDVSSLQPEEDGVEESNAHGTRSGLWSCLESCARTWSEDKKLILWAKAAREDGPSERGGDVGLKYEDFVDIVESHFPRGRFFGVTQPSMAALVQLGQISEEDGREDEDDDEQSDSAEVAIEFDNRLGDQDPQITLYLAVIGGPDFGLSMTLVELESSQGGRGVEDHEGGEDRSHNRMDEGPAEVIPEAEEDPIQNALRSQLATARRESEDLGQESAELKEKLRIAELRVLELEDQVEELRDPPGAAVEVANQHSSGEATACEHERLAADHRLQWEIDQLRGDVIALRSRPVEALEAEVSELRAQLSAQLEDQPHAMANGLATTIPSDDRGTGPAISLVRSSHVVATADKSRPSPQQLRGKLDGIIGRLSGSDYSTMELRSELKDLRELLNQYF